MCRSLGACVLSFIVGGAAQAATLKPVAPETCFVTPGSPATIRWNVQSGPLAGLEYVVRDYAGKQVAAGQAKAAGADAIETTLNLSQGFFEIEFPAAKQRFGLVALPAWQGKKDPFFAIDGALSWLVHDDALREALVRVAARSGIGMVRERLTWGAVHPAADRWDWETRNRFASLRRTYAKHGVEVLEMAHDGPAWMGRVSKYPQDLVAAGASWQKIAARWRPTWGALEIWNEPDISFGGDLPADQYVALAKAVSYGLFGKTDVPLVGGVMAHCNRQYLDTAAENGLLDCIDAFSFHTYGRAMEMEGLVAKYRDWLAAHDPSGLGRYGYLPLWITECGRPWKKGTERPGAGQDAESALDITMKGVEARACGIARYFPFVYPYYEENQNNFGMMDKRGTPLRSMGAYVQMIRALAGMGYLGDLKHADPAIQRARVFGDFSQTVAVVYTGKADAGCKVRLGVPTLHLRGVDGRSLDPASDGAIPVPDGLTYVWLDPSQLGDRLVTYTPAMGLYRLNDTPVPHGLPKLHVAPSPIVLRYLYDPAVVTASSNGYRIKAAEGKKMTFVVRAFNLSGEDRDVAMGIDFSSRGVPAGRAAFPFLKLPARSSGDVTWELDLNRAFAVDDRLKVTVLGSGSGLPPLRGELAPRSDAALVVHFFGEATLVQALGRFQHWVRLPIRESARWTPNVAGHGKVQMDATSEAAWRMRVTFGEGDRWVYPFFKLPDNVRLNEQTALVIRARCQKPAQVRVFLWEGESGVGHITPDSIVPADGQWHVAVVRFEDFVASSANKPDANGRLDLDQVRRISIGMNTKAAENTLEVSDVCVGSLKP